MPFGCWFCGDDDIDIFVHSCPQVRADQEDNEQFDEPVRPDGLTDFEFEMSRQEEIDQFPDYSLEEELLDYAAQVRQWEKDEIEVFPRIKASKVQRLVEKRTHINGRGVSGKKYLKRTTNRAFRRMARQYPEQAPTKFPYSGWVY